MGHKNNNIFNEALGVLHEMQAFGSSKYNDKKNNDTKSKIYSYKTYDTYKNNIMSFLKEEKKLHKCKTLEDARQYVSEYLKSKIDNGYSPWTIKLMACSLAKLYQVNSNSFIELPTRRRSDIVRSRYDVTRDRHFSSSKNSTLIDFCKSCGLRRSELNNIKREDCYKIDGQWFIHVKNGKGGKSRDVPCLPMNKECVQKILNTPFGEKIWPKIHSGCDVHSYRAIFASSLYKNIARPITQIPRNERYYCRGDLKGVVYDKKAMLEVSKALGHERICVIAYSYLR